VLYQSYIYKGEVSDANPVLPHGDGILVFKAGDIYQGSFVNGIPCGKCRWI